MEHLRMKRNGELTTSSKQLKFDPDYVPPHHRWVPYAGPVIWTGPEGNRDYRPSTFRDWQLLGIGDNSTEKTLSCTYISRAPTNQPFPKSRVDGIGEIGWWYNNYRGHLHRTSPIFLPR